MMLPTLLSFLLLSVVLIPSQMMVRSPWKRKPNKRTRMERRRAKGRGVAHPPPPQRITLSSSLTVLTLAVHWGSPCTGMHCTPCTVQFSLCYHENLRSLLQILQILIRVDVTLLHYSPILALLSPSLVTSQQRLLQTQNPHLPMELSSVR